MKISVLLTSFRAQETIDRVKQLLANISTENQVEVIVRAQSEMVAEVLKRYLPVDDRVLLNANPSSDILWMTDDSGTPAITPQWDKDPAIVAQFVPLQPPPDVVHPQNLDDLIVRDTQPDFVDVTKEDIEGDPEVQVDPAEIYTEQDEDEGNVIESPFHGEDDWQIINYVDVDDNTKLAILKKKKND